MANRKNVEVSSLDSRFSLLDDASALKPLTAGSTFGRTSEGAVVTSSRLLSGTNLPIARVDSSGRFVSVSVSSSAKTATVIFKPTQIAKEERQERMNKIIRHGFVTSVRTTTK